jgi:hypothetical protein
LPPASTRCKYETLALFSAPLYRFWLYRIKNLTNILPQRNLGDAVTRLGRGARIAFRSSPHSIMEAP